MTSTLTSSSIEDNDMLWKRVPGRQGTGYYKTKIFSFWRFDCYYVEYGVGSLIPGHVDPVQGKRHFRANVILTKAKKGGYFVCNNMILNWSRLKIFESGKYKHSVTEITEGKRRVLSFGFTK
jgi:hypothetical protein